MTAHRRKIALFFGGLAIVGMGAVTVSCGSRDDKPADTKVPSAPAESGTPAPTEKNVRTNVTRAPQPIAPPGIGGHGNPAVPCGFGPAGGAPCTNNN